MQVRLSACHYPIELLLCKTCLNTHDRCQIIVFVYYQFQKQPNKKQPNKFQEITATYCAKASLFPASLTWVIEISKCILDSESVIEGWFVDSRAAYIEERNI